MVVTNWQQFRMVVPNWGKNQDGGTNLEKINMVVPNWKEFNMLVTNLIKIHNGRTQLGKNSERW